MVSTYFSSVLLSILLGVSLVSIDQKYLTLSHLFFRISLEINFTDLEHEGECPLECMGVIAILKFYRKFWWSTADINSFEIRHELFITKKRYSGDDRGYDVVRDMDLHADYSRSYSAPNVCCI